MEECSQKNKVFFIAEAGVNHNGDINLALEMIDLAKKLEQIVLNFKHFL